MKTLVYGCSNPEYLPAGIWKDQLNKCAQVAEIEFCHEEYLAPDGLSVDHEWYWYVTNKLLLSASALERSAGREIFVFSDCDVYFIQNPVGWAEFNAWAKKQKSPISFGRDNQDSPQGIHVNSGVYVVRGEAFGQIAALNRMIFNLCSEKRLFEGDQSAINWMLPVLRHGIIPSHFIHREGERVCGMEIFYHACGGGPLLPWESKERKPDFAAADSAATTPTQNNRAYYSEKTKKMLSIGTFVSQKVLAPKGPPILRRLSM